MRRNPILNNESSLEHRLCPVRCPVYSSVLKIVTKYPPPPHEATDTWLPNAPVSQATGHCHAKFNQFLVLCINHDWNVPLCTCSQVCSAYETPIL